MQKGWSIGKKAPLDAYLDVVTRANPSTFEEVLKMSNGTLTIEDVMHKVGLFYPWEVEEKEEKKLLKIAKKILKKGMSPEEVAETVELPLEKIRPLVKSKK